MGIGSTPVTIIDGTTPVTPGGGGIYFPGSGDGAAGSGPNPAASGVIFAGKKKKSRPRAVKINNTLRWQ